MPSKRFSWLVKAMLLVRNSSCLDFSTTPSASRIQAGHGSVEPESPFWILVSNHDTPSCKSWHRAEQFSLFRRLLHRPDCRQLLTRTSTGSGCDDAQVSERAIAPLGEAWSNVRLFGALARRMGFEEACFGDTEDELIEQALRPAASDRNEKGKEAGKGKGES